MNSSKRRGIYFVTVAVLAVVALILGLVLSAAPLTDSALAIDDRDMPTEVTNVKINLGDYKELHWAIKDYNSDLRSGTVYSYSYKDINNEPKTYYSTTQMLTAPDPDMKEWTANGPQDVSYSIVRYRPSGDFNHEIQIFGEKLGVGFNVKTNGMNDGYHKNRADEPGRYVAYAEIEAAEGYEFEISGLATGSTLAERGMSITISNNNKIATIQKVWYIAAFDNALLNGYESINQVKEVEFKLDSWKFGEGVNVAFPWVMHGDALLSPNKNNYQSTDYVLKVNGEIISEKTLEGELKLKDDWNPNNANAQNDIVHFTLKMGNTVIADNLPRSRWEYYINKYMPVGHYTVTLNVSTVTLGAHYHWWDESIHDNATGAAETDYIGFERTFNFEVLPGTLSVNDSAVNQNGQTNPTPHLVNVSDLGYGGRVWNFEPMFAPADQIVVENSVKYDDVRAKGGFWGLEQNQDLYDSRPQIRFSFHRMKDMFDDKYLPADSGNWAFYFDGPSTYLVYYMVSMLNYEDNPGFGEERFEHYFISRVYEEVPLPTINRENLVYTGGELIVGPVTAYQQLMQWTGNRQTAAGDYEVVFTLRDSEHYKWSGDVFDFGDEYKIPWKITPYVVEDVTMAERYYTGNSITPVITIPRNQINGEEVCTVIWPEGHSNGKFVDAGTYPVKIVLKDANNYVWNSERNKPAAERSATLTVDFKINKEENKWEISPSIRHWRWGAFDREITLVEGMAARGNENLRFTVYTDRDCLKPAAGLQDFIVEDGQVREIRVEFFEALNAGTYYLQAKVPESKNYTGLTSAPVEFIVGVARNYWDVAPNIIRWTYGGFDATLNVISGVPHYGEGVFFTIKKCNGNGDDTPVVGLENFTIDENGHPVGNAAAVFAGLNAGNYHLIATAVRAESGYVDEDLTKPIYNYTELVGTIEFNVHMATNFWVQTPNIARWMVGEQIHAPQAEAKFGKVEYVITDADGVEYYNSKTGVNNLVAALANRWYTLEATVQSDNVNYTGLKSSTQFRVFGDSTVNYWTSVPNIQGWVEGETAKAPVGSCAFGAVQYTYKTAAGQAVEGVPTAAGDYILVATAVSEGRENIVAEVAFTIAPKAEVKEDNKTGLIAAVAVLAVVSAVSIAAFVANTIIAKKKSKPVHAHPFNDENSDI